MKKNVIVLPKTSNQELLAEYYSLADLFLICSKKENFPTTCIEAQCCGTPVVGFDAGGTKETSIEGESNFVEYLDFDSLEKLIVNRLSGEKDTTLSERAKEIYSNRAMIDEYLKIYGKLEENAKVLLIDVNCKSSSTGKIVYDLYKGIKENGKQAAVCYGRGKKLVEENIYKFGRDYETIIHAFLARITGYNGCFSPISTFRLLRYIKKYNPDVIHIHELHAYFVNISPLIKYIKKKGIKLVWTFHCEYMYTGKCGHALDCVQYKACCGNCPQKKEYPKSLFFDHTKQMFQRKKALFEDLDVDIIVPSQWLFKRVKESFLSDKSIGIIHNGINTDIFCERETSALRKRLKIPKENKVILSVAPNIMSEMKGGRLILELAERMQDRDITFVLVGADNE